MTACDYVASHFPIGRRHGHVWGWVNGRANMKDQNIILRANKTTHRFWWLTFQVVASQEKNN